jgi:hypothetical protein
MIYEIINPHSPCTFEAPDIEVAALAMALLSNNRYGAEPQDINAEDVPPFFMGGAEQWWQERFNQPAGKRIEQRQNEIKAALCSIMHGSIEERQIILAQIAQIEGADERNEILAEWGYEKLCSTIDLVSEGQRIADQMQDRPK